MIVEILKKDAKKNPNSYSQKQIFADCKVFIDMERKYVNVSQKKDVWSSFWFEKIDIDFTNRHFKVYLPE